MHDTLQYMAREPVHRKYHQNDLTFGLLYAFSENFVLPLSHDEVVHGKGSLIAKMPGDAWQKFANLRAYYAFMWGYPGKKLLFMGQEFAQGAEWSEARGLDWWQLDIPAAQAACRRSSATSTASTATRPALHAARLRGRGLRVADRRRRRELGLRLAAQGAAAQPPVAVISNFTPVPRAGYGLPLPHAGRWREILNTDAAAYGGSSVGNMGGVDADRRRARHRRARHPAAARDDLAGTRTGRRDEPRPTTKRRGEGRGGETDVTARARRHGLRAGRRPRQPAQGADRPPRQARGLLRRQGPHHRLRALERAQLRHPPHRRRHPVQGALA